ncbi:glycosyltransferase WbuB, partial [candidate division KSB1 bacterium]
EENCGLVFRYGNNDELAHCMIKLAKDKGLRETCGRNAERAAFNKYNWENTSQDLLSFYRRLSESG